VLPELPPEPLPVLPLVLPELLPLVLLDELPELLPDVLPLVLPEVLPLVVPLLLPLVVPELLPEPPSSPAGPVVAVVDPHAASATIHARPAMPKNVNLSFISCAVPLAGPRLPWPTQWSSEAAAAQRIDAVAAACALAAPRRSCAGPRGSRGSARRGESLALNADRVAC
jgi:hypothetical protein